MLKEYNELKREIKNSYNIKWIFIILNVYRKPKKKKEKINIYSWSIDCGFKKITPIDDEELSFYFKV